MQKYLKYSDLYPDAQGYQAAKTQTQKHLSRHHCIKVNWVAKKPDDVSPGIMMQSPTKSKKCPKDTFETDQTDFQRRAPSAWQASDQPVCWIVMVNSTYIENKWMINNHRQIYDGYTVDI